MDKDFLISLTIFWSDCHMTFNITQMCQIAGKKVEDEDGRWVVDYPMSKLKKAFKLILKYADEKDVQSLKAYLKENFPKYGKLFDKVAL